MEPVIAKVTIWQRVPLRIEFDRDHPQPIRVRFRAKVVKTKSRLLKMTNGIAPCIPSRMQRE